MNYLEIKEIIKNKLPKNHKEVIKEIDRCIESGSTGGEITSMIGFYLKNLDRNNFKDYHLIKEDIEIYLKSCKDMGLIIK